MIFTLILCIAATLGGIYTCHLVLGKIKIGESLVGYVCITFRHYENVLKETTAKA